MKVIKLEDDFYEVQDYGRHWTVSTKQDPYFICNSVGRELKPTGTPHKHITKAIKEHLAEA